MIRGIRGAITITDDTPEEVFAATQQVVQEMTLQNDIAPDDVASVIISTTPDITSSFPAKAVRTMDGWHYVPVMCTHEMNVPESMPYCIRVMMHVNTNAGQQDIVHVYLNEAVMLRPDLVKK